MAQTTQAASSGRSKQGTTAAIRYTMKASQQTSFVVVMVLFHPPDELQERLEKLLQAGYPLALFDNTPQKAPNWQESFAGRCVWYSADGQNHGLGAGMAALMQAIKTAGYDWACYFDQDTRFSADTLQWTRKRLEQSVHTLHKVAAVQITPATTANEARKVKLLINSGCLFHLPLLTDWGHDPNFFVEAVDYKFCLDAASRGFELWQWPGCPDFDHDSPQPMLAFQWREKIWTYRPYPLHRHMAFLGRLCQLAALALVRRQWTYVYIFMRNVATHLMKQLQLGLLSAAEQLGLVKKCVSL